MISRTNFHNYSFQRIVNDSSNTRCPTEIPSSHQIASQITTLQLGNARNGPGNLEERHVTVLEVCSSRNDQGSEYATVHMSRWEIDNWLPQLSNGVRKLSNYNSGCNEAKSVRIGTVGQGKSVEIWSPSSSGSIETEITAFNYRNIIDLLQIPGRDKRLVEIRKLMYRIYRELESQQRDHLVRIMKNNIVRNVEAVPRRDAKNLLLKAVDLCVYQTGEMKMLKEFM